MTSTERARQWRAKQIASNPLFLEEESRRRKERYQANLKKNREYFREKAASRRAKDPEANKEYRRRHRAQNRDHINETKKQWRKNRSDEQKEKDREYDRKRREENPEKVKAWMDNWRANNKDKVLAYTHKHREKLRAYSKEYARKNRPKAIARHKQRCQEDPTYHIVARLRARMGVAVRRAATRKSSKSIELLGCSEAELVAHLESQFKDGMSWENRDQWHVDHIRPISSFKMDDPEEQKAAFGYKNLQPLWIPENLSKSDKITA